MFIKVKLLLSLKDWKIGTLTFLMIPFPRDGFYVLEKYYQGCNKVKRLGDDLHQTGREEFIIANFLA